MADKKNSLADKLKSLGVKTGTTHLAPPKVDSHSIDSVVAGSFVPTPRGDVFIAEQTYPSDYIYGSSPLISPSPLSFISQWARDPEIEKLPLSKFAFLDTETSGLSGGTGTYAFLVGAARFIDDKFVLQQFFMRDPAEEPALLEGLAKFLAPCEALVTFNGKAFDAPLLTTRYKIHYIPVPYQEYSHLDLLALGPPPLARQTRITRVEISRRACAGADAFQRGSARIRNSLVIFRLPADGRRASIGRCVLSQRHGRGGDGGIAGAYE